jgi:glutaminase A-like protein/uncharacterized protein DUF5127/uncharacterized protein DUF4964
VIRGIATRAAAATFLLAGGAVAQVPQGDPPPPPPALPTFRPPAVPLVTHDPYFSVWSRADRLADAWPSHWTGREQQLCSMVRIDGEPRRLLGAGPQQAAPLPQISTTVGPTTTICEFADARVRVVLSFVSPLLPTDLDVLSRPVTYVTWDVRARDGRRHDVELYFDVSAQICVNEPVQEVTWNRADSPKLAILSVGTFDQPVLQKSGDDLRIDWGYGCLAAPKQDAPQAAIASHDLARGAFLATEPLPKREDARRPRACSDDGVVLAIEYVLPRVGPEVVRRHALLAYDDEWSIDWFGQRLRPYWRRRGEEIGDVLALAEAWYGSLYWDCQRFDAKLMRDLEAAGGPKYAEVAALAWRQCLAANKLCADANGRPLLFPKENFSNGCIGTVDVIYPMAPLFLLTSSDLCRAMLVPVLEYGSSPRWKFPFAPHDLGTYPFATGQVYGGGERGETDQMPVEESANLLILVAALAQAEGSADLAAKYWTSLSKWADYLKEKGFDPERQLCTDDFAGHLAHNVNLSAKAIVALGAYARLCEKLKQDDAAKSFRSLAEDFARRWLKEADDGDHFRLTFDGPGTWSQKYNLVWDDLLQLGLFPADAKRKEMAWYRKVVQRYGLPLDSRADFTKIDWSVWTATLTGERADFTALVDPLWDFLNESPDRVPMCDWFKTREPRTINMIARPVVGGIFLPLLCDRATWKRRFAEGAASKGEWAPFPVAPAKGE